MCLSVFRQGDVGTNWYAVLSGSLDMNVSETGDSKVSQSTHLSFVFGSCGPNPGLFIIQFALKLSSVLHLYCVSLSFPFVNNNSIIQ